ncbi:transposase [Streptomyces racemochromogenes]|uniref:transposase n=1 Tax=Streptomyces racemochromogenes TaxID=67353 RepID=UPI0031EC6053
MANRKPRRPRRQFTPEFKAEIVELCRRGDRSVPEVVKDFDLTETAVRLWVAQAQGQGQDPRAAHRPDTSLRTFDFDADPSIYAAAIHTLAGCEPNARRRTASPSPLTSPSRKRTCSGEPVPGGG